MKMVIKDKRDAFFDIVKAIGIISVVLGHCFKLSKRFVYCYHLPIFFFVTGYFYNKKKYQDKPVNNIIDRFKNNYFKYIFYMTLFIIFHNFFCNMGIINTGRYGIIQIFGYIINATMFNVIVEDVSGPLWFVPVMLYGISLFGIIVYIGNKFRNKKVGNIFIILSNLFLGIIGILLNIRKIKLVCNLETSIVIMPLILLGYICKNYTFCGKTFKDYLTYFGFICSLLLIIMMLFMYPNMKVDLSSNLLFQGKLFYLITVLGIYMVLCISKFLNMIKYLRDHLAWIGKYSFEIMALHMFVRTIVIWLFYQINKIPFFINHPIAIGEIWYVYLIICIYGSIGIAIILNKLKVNFKKIVNKTNIFEFNN